jgi:hypothetical protein
MGNPKQPAENSKKPRGKPFQPGKTGNAGGRPKLPEDVKHVRELARQYTAQAVGALVEVLQSDSAAGKVAAANALLDRGWGKAEQPITGPEGGPILVDEVKRPKLTKAEWLAAHGVGTAARPAE